MSEPKALPGVAEGGNLSVLLPPASGYHNPQPTRYNNHTPRGKSPARRQPAMTTPTTNLDLHNFRSALARLDEALRERAHNPANPFLRDSVILRYTITFEDAIAALARYLESVAGLRDTNRMSPRRCIREAAALGLIAECSNWMRYVANRNRVSHAYLEPTAIMVAQEATAFATAARALLDAMTRGIANDA